MLCHVGSSKSLSSIDHSFLHLYNFSYVHLFDHVRRMCDLCVVNLLRFLGNFFLVILVRLKYMLLSQISSIDSNGDVSSCLNLNRCFDLTTIDFLQFLTKLLKRSFFFLKIR